MNNVIVLPILIPLLTMIANLFSWKKLAWQRFFTILGMVILFFTSLCLFYRTLQSHFLVLNLGNWPAPFGINLVTDLLSSTLILVESIIAVCVAIYSCSDIDRLSANSGFYPAFCVLISGVAGSFLTGDLFNLYVWFEVMLVSSFILLTLNASKKQLEGTLKYAILNLIATLILLTAIAFLYGLTGTLNLADLAVILHHSNQTQLISTIAIIFLIAFSSKAALFPLFFWMPASYHTPDFSTSALFAGLLSKVGVYALIRTYSLLFFKTTLYFSSILWLLSIVTLLIGIFSALSQKDNRQIFSFSLISHIGYMTLGLALFTPLAIIGSIFYMIQHMLIKTQLFMSCGIIHELTGTNSIKKSGDLYKKYPFFSALFFIGLFALAGMPPFSGFWGKLILLKASFELHDYMTGAVIIITGFLTILLAVKIWQNQFLREEKQLHEHSVQHKKLFVLLIPTTILTAFIILIGIIPEPLYHLSSLISWQLLHPENYIYAVLQRGA